MPPRRGLGRGLDALIARPPAASAGVAGPAAAAGAQEPAAGEPGAAAPLLVEVDRIVPNPRQPRRQLPDEHLEELAASIREHGIIQPLVVTQLPPADDDGAPRYQLITGQRRWQAAKRAGLVRVPV